MHEQALQTIREESNSCSVLQTLDLLLLALNRLVYVKGQLHTFPLTLPVDCTTVSPVLDLLNISWQRFFL